MPARPDPPILSAKALNRALLARQLLLDRADVSIPAALEQLAGLQMQYAPSGYVGLWSRLRRFSRDALTAALETRKVVQGTLMRSTIHLVSAADYWPFAVGTAGARRDWLLRVERDRFAGADLDTLLTTVRRHLEAQPQRHAEMLRLLEADGVSRLGWVAAGHLLPLVRLPPSGTWAQRRADLYGLAEEWLGPASVTERDAHELLVRRYLVAFGPAPLTAVAAWSGIPVATLRPLAERLELRRFVDERGELLLDVPGAPLPAPDTPAPVRFLPTWDATLLVHARRTGILPEVYRPLVFNTRTPHSVPTFLVDGAVAGTWRFEKGRVDLHPFGPLEPDVLHELELEAERLAAFHG